MVFTELSVARQTPGWKAPPGAAAESSMCARTAHRAGRTFTEIPGPARSLTPAGTSTHRVTSTSLASSAGEEAISRSSTDDLSVGRDVPGVLGAAGEEPPALPAGGYGEL